MGDSLGNHLDLHRMAVTRGAHLNNCFSAPFNKRKSCNILEEARNIYFTHIPAVNQYLHY